MSELEYNALRAEFIQRIDTKNQLMDINVAVIAGLLALVAIFNALVLLLLYAPLSTLLAAMWARNEINILLLDNYIRTKIEPLMPGLDWERWKRSQMGNPRYALALKDFYRYKLDLILFTISQVFMVLLFLYITIK
jgi:hypothetical protein